VLEHKLENSYLSYVHMFHPYPDPDKKSHQELDADGNCPYCYKDGRNKVRKQGFVMYQWHWGERWYYRAGPSVGHSTNRSAWLNLCQTFGYNGALDISFSHCSNGGLIRPNSGIDFVTIRIY